jgi:leader peptidase (prepilin peptidase)/N-methyltransferase
VIFLFYIFLLGLLVGSFLNVCIHRWPLDLSIVKPRSRCPKCESPIAWYDNIPVLSYVWLRRRCRHCGQPISWIYPVVELSNAILWVVIVDRIGWQPLSWKMMLFVSMMIILIFTDLTEYILPDEITWGGLVIGLLISPLVLLEPGLSELIWLFAGTRPELWIVSLVESAFAALFLGGVLFLVSEFYYRVRGREGLGLGDVKMMAMVGAFWGMQKAFMILLMGSLVGALLGGVLILVRRKEWTHELPYGSYLGLTAIIATLFGDDIFRWYVSVMFGDAA